VDKDAVIVEHVVQSLSQLTIGWQSPDAKVK
jgi:hypothetical protein